MCMANQSTLQINTFDLDVDTLCNWYGDWTTIDLVMRDWQETNSPLAYWRNEMSDANYQRRFETLELDRETFRDSGITNMSYGLPTDEAMLTCKRKYQSDIAKLTVQIIDPNVMQIKKNRRVTFADQLAAIGECRRQFKTF